MNVYLPKRIKPCPRCGDRDRVQYVVEGMPRAPSPDEEDRLYFKGCLIDVVLDEHGEPMPGPKWYCPDDAVFYH